MSILGESQELIGFLAGFGIVVLGVEGLRAIES
jgi:hypothetical protein